MLRVGVLVFGGIMLAAAALCALAGCRLAVVIPLAVWGTIFAGGVLFERWRYQLRDVLRHRDLRHLWKPPESQRPRTDPRPGLS